MLQGSYSVELEFINKEGQDPFWEINRFKKKDNLFKPATIIIGKDVKEEKPESMTNKIIRQDFKIIQEDMIIDDNKRGDIDRKYIIRRGDTN